MSHAMLGIYALLIVGTGAAVVSALKLLQRVEAYLPPVGASRVHFAPRRGEPFPNELLPERNRKSSSKQTLLILFYSESCSVCTNLLPCLAGLARSYRDVQFVVCLRSAVRELKLPNALVITNKSMYRRLRIASVPYAVKIERGRVIEYGIVNSGEQMESVLNATWQPD